MGSGRIGQQILQKWGGRLQRTLRYSWSSVPAPCLTDMVICLIILVALFPVCLLCHVVYYGVLCIVVCCGVLWCIVQSCLT